MSSFKLKFAAALTFVSMPLALFSQSALYPDLFDLGDVELLDSRFKDAMELNTETLLKYDVDRLLAPYLKEAGLAPKGESFDNWIGLDGHVGGHYLSALAIHGAATGDARIKARMEYMLDELERCLEANADGYAGGIPDGRRFFSEIKKGNVAVVWDYWVPWYNVHKMYAGLRDAWLYGKSMRAKDMFLRFCDWGLTVIEPLTDRQMESMLDSEFGGMDEIFADAYQMTGDVKYLDAAKRFSHHWLLDSMAARVDNLDNRHANTQVPKVVGYQRIALLDTADTQYADAARFFWETVTGTRSLSFGGNSRREHFAPAADCKSYMDEREGPETCNTNNMLKLTEDLFRADPDSRYADFYERALYNHILSSQHPRHGGYVYFTSARPAHYRVYSAPNEAMWCCVGTGMENHGKYGEFIYSRSGDSLRVNLFIPSRLDWKEKGLTVEQKTSFPAGEKTILTINVTDSRKFPVMIRRPQWCDGFEVKVNGKKQSVSYFKGYAVIDRKWKTGDRIEVELPMKFSLEEAPNVPDYISIMRGPVVMASRVKTDDIDSYVADDGRWAHIAHGKLISVFDTPIIIGDRGDILKTLNALSPSGDSMRYELTGVFRNQADTVVLEPFSGIHDTRYMMYWLSMTPRRYAEWKSEAEADEAERLTLDRRTVDAVNTGEQQPEADHAMKNRNSRSGNFNGEAWRDASAGGFFSFDMDTFGKDKLALMVRYHLSDDAPRGMVIKVDGNPIAEVGNDSLGKGTRFENVEYAVPSEYLAGKQKITVTFEARGESPTGPVYHVRLLSPQSR